MDTSQRRNRSRQFEMSRFSGTLIALSAAMAVAGCQGAGTRSSLFSPGATKVAPPATGSYGTQDKNYYNNGGGSGSSGGSSGGNRTGSGHSSLDRPSDERVVGSGISSDNLSWQSAKQRSPGDNGVASASFARDEGHANSASDRTANLRNRLRGMRTNDATQEPPNSERIEITDLPPPGSTPPPRRIRISNAEPTRITDSVAEPRSASGSSKTGSSPLRWTAPK